MTDPNIARIRSHPASQRLRRKRQRLGWTLTVAMLIDDCGFSDRVRRPLDLLAARPRAPAGRGRAAFADQPARSETGYGASGASGH